MSNLCRKSLALLLACALGVSMTAFNTKTETTNAGTYTIATEAANILAADDITINETLENTVDGEHVIEADGTEETYSHISIKKSGNSEGDEADFYGENSAVFATNGSTLNLSDILLETNGTHANGIFSYGEGTTVNISDSVIETTGNCSGALMTTGGGTMNASNLNIHTTGNSSAAIRSDRGGGTVTVNGGKYTTDGTGSPVIYSTADITVSDAAMESTASQGVVVEGKNSVTLNNVDLTADNNTKNSDKSDYYQAVMIYQSMSGDASEGQGTFTMNGGTLTNQNGDVFFINNTTAQIDLTDISIVNNDSNGLFLRAAAAGWGNEGSNGGQVELNASSQDINGNLLVDAVSNLNLSLKNESTLTGAINPDGQEGGVYVELDENSTWTLTEDSYITGLTCDEDAIQLNGHKLYVNGVEYTENTASTGEAIDLTAVSGSGQGQNQSGQQPPAKPDGDSNSGNLPPDQNGENGEQPPQMPANNFTDVESTDYFAEPVYWAAASNITTGTSETTFSPSDTTTRAQIVTFLWRLAGSPDPSSTKTAYADVDTNAYYYKAVLWAEEKGITTGTSETNFSPDAECTRSQIVTFLHRYADKPSTEKTSSFTDVDTGAYYADAVSWAAENSITSGTSETTFSPDDSCTRGQAVTFLYNYAKLTGQAGTGMVPPSGDRPEPPSGEAPSGNPPEPPSGEAPSGNPPELPSGETSSGAAPVIPSTNEVNTSGIEV